MPVTSGTIVPKAPQGRSSQWPVFTRKLLAGFARELTKRYACCLEWIQLRANGHKQGGVDGVTNPGDADRLGIVVRKAEFAAEPLADHRYDLFPFINGRYVTERHDSAVSDRAAWRAAQVPDDRPLADRALFERWRMVE